MTLPRRVLVVQTAFLGDLVLTQPLVEELARAFAPAAVDLLVKKPFADLARSFRGVGEVIPFDKRGEERGLRGILRQRGMLRARGYDLAIAAQGSIRTGLVLASAGIARRIGFADAAAAWLFHERVPNPQGPYPERLRALGLAAGAGPGPADPRLDVQDAARASVEKRLADAGIAPADAMVAINPGSVWGTKRWLPEGYGAVAAELRDRGFKVVLVGGREDAGVSAEVARHAKGAAIDLAGATSLPELVALCARARVFVSGDSGPMHIAAAVGTPVVAIFGPTTPSLGFAPRIRAAEIVERSLECRPCDSHGPQVCPLGHFRCMREIAPADVLAAFGRLAPKRTETV